MPTTVPQQLIDPTLLASVADLGERVVVIESISASSSSASIPTEPAIAGVFIRNTNRAAQGSYGARYILDGWEYDGTTWQPRLFFTGS